MEPNRQVEDKLILSSISHMDLYPSERLCAAVPHIYRLRTIVEDKTLLRIGLNCNPRSLRWK